MNISLFPPCKLIDNLDSSDKDMIDIPFDLEEIKRFCKIFKETCKIPESTKFLDFLHFIDAYIDENALINKVKIYGRLDYIRIIVFQESCSRRFRLLE